MFEFGDGASQLAFRLVWRAQLCLASAVGVPVRPTAYFVAVVTVGRQVRRLPRWVSFRGKSLRPTAGLNYRELATGGRKAARHQPEKRGHGSIETGRSPKMLPVCQVAPGMSRPMSQARCATPTASARSVATAATSVPSRQAGSQASTPRATPLI